MRMGGLTKLGTLGRGPMKQLTTCSSVFVLEMAKGSGLANLWVSKPPAFQASVLSLSIWRVQVTKCQYEAAYNQILTHTVMYIDCAICQKLNYVWDDCKYLPTVQTQGGYVTCLLFLGQLFRCIFYCSDGWILSHHHRLINLTQQNSSTTTCLS